MSDCKDCGVRGGRAEVIPQCIPHKSISRSWDTSIFPSKPRVLQIYSQISYRYLTEERFFRTEESIDRATMEVRIGDRQTERVDGRVVSYGRVEVYQISLRGTRWKRMAVIYRIFVNSKIRKVWGNGV